MTLKEEIEEILGELLKSASWDASIGYSFGGNTYERSVTKLEKLIEAEVQDALARQATPTALSKQADNLSERSER